MWRYGLALIFVAGALFLRIELDPILQNNYVFPTFFAAVILANWLCGLGPTLLTIALAVVLSDWYFVSPRHNFFEIGPDQWIGVSTDIAVSLLVAWYGWASRRAQKRLAAEVQQRKQAEEGLSEAKEALVAQNLRLERTVDQRTAELQATVGELQHFSYALAHDMRAPLRAMSGYLTLVERRAGDALSQPDRDMLRRVSVATEQLDAMITDALNYNRAMLRDFSLEPVDLGAVLSGLIETYPNLHSDKADIELVSGLPMVLGNRAALIQCFSNLLGNAVKFSKPGLKPRIRVWAEDRPSPAVSEGFPGVRFARIWVEDNGVGIAKESQERLFGMFQRLHAGYEGTGIGLAIVRKVVQRMGGQVGVEAEEGRGSRFWVELQQA